MVVAVGAGIDMAAQRGRSTGSQALQHASLLVRKAAWSLDKGIRDPMTSSCAKAFGADAAMASAIDAVQVFGGYGYVKDYPVEKLMRDAKILQIYEGTAQVQRLVIARQVIGK